MTNEEILKQRKEEEQATIDAMLEEHTISEFEEMDNDSFIDLSEEIGFPDIAISYGTHEYFVGGKPKTTPTPLVTYGNFMVIQAEPKVGKSFFMSLMSSVAVSRKGVNKYSGKLKGHSRGGCILHIDTEQGKWHCQNMFRRTSDLNEGDIDMGCYHTHGLRKYSYNKRRDFIDWKLKKMTADGLNIDYVFIDGIADLICDENDKKESKAITQDCMDWSETYDCAIITVIHTNPAQTNKDGKKTRPKATGHLGTQVGKKAELVAHLEIDEDNKTRVLTKVFSRNRTFKEIKFGIHRSMPQVLGGNTDNVGTF